ncbi:MULTISPECIES: cysteine hydrolase family protein [Pasteurellaceae]|uniref:Cysteine hydrolase family protein n=1 Tax=Pasteurella atlantica TaxID=2827233 RepID=A0AAW8CNB5_9PAST|nr:cysteine hydrolase family protein [Pasteurella atlantica]MBR0572904.1 cysteine hydrolase [Pasteurella atlantica]MDP8038968.1 cysteine hydrolase family protein [Pasteurella atlantica]MDP8040923.1 cysteine hydrolase family protein [Pasteurella atlantica]MDP8043059.1 cysteine hydrolase family protein [Pasteurella atlantica]MDP8045145.1 cysteine hydrolase family protein [Pasteurella atlantica]
MNKALIIIDIQNDYFPNGKIELFESEKASINAKKILDKFREKNQLVVHIKHLSTRPDASFFLPDTLGAEIHNSVKPQPNEKVFIKHFPNSFRDTELFEYLKNNDIENLVILGMMTHMCVDATVRAGKDLGFKIKVIGDACATKNLEIFGKKVDAENVQKSFLSALNYFYAEVINTNDFDI